MTLYMCLYVHYMYVLYALYGVNYMREYKCSYT